MMIGLGRMGMSLRDFYCMTPYEWSLAFKGWKQNRIDQLRDLRLTLFTMVRLHGNPKKAPKDMMKWMPIEGDEELKEQHTASVNPEDVIRRYKENNWI